MKNTLLLLGMFAISFHGFAQVSKQHALSMLPRIKDVKEVNDDLSPIQELEASIGNNDTVLLTWDFPIGNNSEITLSWSNMNNNAYYGAQAAQCATDQCQLFDRMDLRSLAGWKFKDISTVLSHYDTLFPPLGNYSFRIWKGDENDLTLVYEQPVDNPVFDVVITHSIDSVITVDSDEELRIGYYMDWYADYPWVVDDLPIVDEYKGGRVRFYRDWNPSSECRPIDWANVRSGTLCISSTLTSPEGTEGIAQGITGYRIYRDGTLIKEIPYSFVTYFTDTEFTRETDVEYCVTAVYGDEESEPICATVTITGTEEAPKIDGITVSPNPTNGIVRIEGSTVTEVQVYNTLGQLVKTVRNSYEVNLMDLPQGIYTVRVAMGDGNDVIRKVVKE